MTRPLLALLVLLVAACAAALPVAIDGGQPAPGRSWLPDGEPRAAILALHGFGDHAAAFELFGDYAASRGIVVRAYDQPGFGSRADHGRWPGAPLLRDALRSELAALRAAYPDLPVYVLGESMGAAVAVTAFAADDAPAVAGVILSAPAVWGGDALNPVYRMTLALAAAIAPGLRLSGSGLGILASDNLEMLRALGRDPLFLRHPQVIAVAGLVALMGEARLIAPRLRRPVLVLSGARDEVVPPRAQASFIATLGARDCTAIGYPEGWHLLLRDLQRERVYADILAWLERRPAPSGLAAACGDSATLAAQPVVDSAG